jgi:hypothetical protein
LTRSCAPSSDAARRIRARLKFWTSKSEAELLLRGQLLPHPHLTHAGLVRDARS